MKWVPFRAYDSMVFEKKHPYVHVARFFEAHNWLYLFLPLALYSLDQGQDQYRMLQLEKTLTI